MVPILPGLVNAPGQQVESDLLGIDPGAIEIGLQRLIRGAAQVLHHAEFSQRLAVFLIQVGGLFEFVFCPRQVFFLFHQELAQHEVKPDVLGIPGQLCLCGSDGPVRLLLRQVHVEHAAQCVGGIRILIESLLVSFLRFGILALCQPQVAQQHIGGGINGFLFQGPMDVLIRGGVLLAINFGARAQQVSVRSCGL